MILEGKTVADKICDQLKVRVDRLKDKDINPALTIVTSGDDSACHVYVRNKIRRADELGIEVKLLHYDYLSLVTARDIVRFHAVGEETPIIFQLPINGEFSNPLSLMECLTHHGDTFPAALDVDGCFAAESIAAVASGAELDPVRRVRSGIGLIHVPCTPKGIMRLLDHYAILSPDDYNNLSVCVIGRSNLVGRPIARLLEHCGCTVTLCNSRTEYSDLLNAFWSSDLIISATGNPSVFMAGDLLDPEKAELLKTKTIVDVGMNRNEEGKLCGDLPEEIYGKAANYTPVPGGVGPMTVAMLMENVVNYYEAKYGMMGQEEAEEAPECAPAAEESAE